MKIKKVLQGVLMAGVLVSSIPAHAGADPFIGEVQWFAGNYAPRGWAFCDGQILPISQYTALFSILGTTYGGDGRTTFALPDMRGRVAIHRGQGPGLSNHPLGQKAGTEAETLTINQLPSHTHGLQASNNAATAATPTGGLPANGGRSNLYDTAAANTSMSASAISATGGGQPHNNMQPYVSLSCIIALQGLYPSRN